MEATIQINSQEIVKKETNTDSSGLKEAIRHTIEELGYFIYSCEPMLDVDDDGMEVRVSMQNADILDVDDVIDDSFIESVIIKIENLKNKELENGD